MTIEGLLVGAAAVLIGTAFCVAGYPLFLILLPLWAFLHGLIDGGGATAQALGDGFLATGVGIGVGLFLGALFAVLAYAFWWAGVILLGATIGYMLGAGVLHAIGVGQGLLTFIVGLAVAAVFGVAFVVYRMPRVLVAAITAIAGAATAVGGALVALNIVSLDNFKDGPLAAVSEQGWVSAIAVIALAIAGFVIQLRLSKNTEVQIWRNAMGEET